MYGCYVDLKQPVVRTILNKLKNLEGVSVTAWDNDTITLVGSHEPTTMTTTGFFAQLLLLRRSGAKILHYRDCHDNEDEKQKQRMSEAMAAHR